MKSSAVFLDRDGTIIEDRGYMGDPSEVCLLPGAAEAIRRFRKLGHLVVVVSNQSGVARGMYDEDALWGVHDRVESLLAVERTELDGAYYCPYLEGKEARVAEYRRPSSLRKPEPGMLLKAARELNIDLNASWMIGDSARDVEAGRRAECRTIRLNSRGDNGPAVSDGKRSDSVVADSVVADSVVADSVVADSVVADSVVADFVVPDLMQAVGIVEKEMAKTRDKPPTPPVAPPAPEPEEPAIAPVLERLVDHLDRSARRERQQDFSLARLAGALVQMLAIVVALWGVSALFSDRFDVATARFVFACFLQLGSMAAFLLDRFH